MQLFLVRVWCRLGQFRAALRPVPGEAAQIFSDPRQLADYLAALAAEPAPFVAPAPMPPVPTRAPAVPAPHRAQAPAAAPSRSAVAPHSPAAAPRDRRARRSHRPV